MRLSLALVVLPLLVLATSPAVARDLTFEERVRAQKAIERVYYSHRIGATLPFEEAVPGSVIEEKVRDALRKSVALERIWHTPITPEALEAEWARIRKGSRFPERLAEVQRALGDDRLLLLETLVRSSLANRLLPRFFMGSPAAAEESWSSWWSRTAPELDERAAPSVAADPGTRTDVAADCLPFDTWDPGIFGDWPGPRSGSAVTWTGTEMLIFGGETVNPGTAHTGYRYDPLIDDWTAMPPLDTAALSSNLIHAWTGDAWVIWDSGSRVGRRYSPASDTWSPISDVNSPSVRGGAFFVWNGTALLVWGGNDLAEGYRLDGGRYDPATFTSTQSSNNTYESITEELSSGGNPSLRFSRLEHRWTVSVGPGSVRQLHVEGFRSSSTDGDDFRFEWSTDGTTWTPIALTSLPFADEGIDLVGELPAGATGTVTFRVVDTDRGAGNQALDSVSIDEWFVRVVF